MDNTAFIENSLAWSVVDHFAKGLPPDWSAHVQVNGPATATVKLSTPDVSAELRAWVVPRLTPRAAKELRTGDRRPPDVVLAPFLSPLAREHLQDAGVGYVDLTGNTYLVLRRPALFIETTGAQTNPNPKVKGASLKGAKAGVVVRALCDFVAPIGIRQLAKRANVTPGYASRLVKLLAEEALLEREERGPVLHVDVARLLRRWADYYSLTGANRTRTYLDARGTSSCLQKLASGERRYAVTGSFGAAGLAPVAAPRLLVAFVDNVERTAQELGLRAAEHGANVILAEPFDPAVYERTWEKDGVTYVAPSQLVVDLLSSPGRGPNEAEELLQWMSENEDAWRKR